MAVRSLPFVKMHGLGNDFVIIDARAAHGEYALGGVPASVAQKIANRRFGVGCDQLIIVEPSTQTTANAFMRIQNADGSESGACGNATRCVAHLLMEESGADQVHIATSFGMLQGVKAPRGLIRVDMGAAKLEWRDIPLAEAMETSRLSFALGPLQEPAAVSMGNPHVVFFVESVDDIALDVLGPQIEHHALFPERTNVEIVEVLEPHHDGTARLRTRVWERGVGITQACGSGACAVLVAACRRGLAGGEGRPPRGDVILDGGSLEIEWMGNGHVEMTGPVSHSFVGALSEDIMRP